MNEYKKYQLKERIKAVGRISWDLLVEFSNLIVFLFILITAISFWRYIALTLYSMGIDVLYEIQTIFYIVIIAVIIKFINRIANLR